jgi:AraC-like DNA-binding protein
VPERRTLRFWFCAGAGIFIFLLILSREVLFAGAEWLNEAQYLATALVLLGLNALLLRFPEGSFEPIQRSESPGPEGLAPVGDESPGGAVESVEELPLPASEPAWEAQLAPVRHLMEEEGIYREHGMTIGRLASAADLPEYRLRQLINGGLGYRNFNDFLNRFRIDEASRRLADPSEARIPVLTIALDVGFRSISSFNKSFKDTHGVTPTAYRKARLKDGDSAESGHFSDESA